MQRFNLKLLRELGSKTERSDPFPLFKDFRLTRRSFLTLSGAGAAFGAVHPFFRGDGFALVWEGTILHVVVGDERRWTINPAWFGRGASVDVVHAERETIISLKNASYPATDIPADFVCRLRRQAGVWMLHLAMDCGAEVSGNLLEWLDGTVAAGGSWQMKRFSPIDGLVMAFDAVPSVLFTPDWMLSVAAPLTLALRGLEKKLPATGFRLALNSAETIAGTPVEGSTTVVIDRRNARWTIPLARRNDAGWALHHDETEAMFDELRVEAADTRGGILRSALLVQSPANGNALHFQPGGTLCDDCDEPFSMPLKNTRLALSLEDDLHSSLVANLDDSPRWAHDRDVSYRFGVAPDASHFELHEGNGAAGVPQVRPGICEICFPNDSVCMNLKLGIPRPVPFTWVDLFAPFEQLLGWLHLAPTHEGKGPHRKLILDLAHGDILSIDRPHDMLSLKFAFENMQLHTGGFCPSIKRIDHAHDARVRVIFPPQHVAEQVFFNTSGSSLNDVVVPIGPAEVDDYNNKDPKPTITTPQQLAKLYDPEAATVSTEPVTEPSQTRLSEETRLAFTIPPGYDIPCETEALLKWDDWTPYVAPVACSNVKITDPGSATSTGNVPQIVKPVPNSPTDYTSIEIPWHLNLSPSDLGRWAHSYKPVESKRANKAVELWHTRLGVQPKAPHGKQDKLSTWVDETNTKDRTMRAIWSLDFVAVPNDKLDCNSNAGEAPVWPQHFSYSDPATPTSPFRMSLDVRDRHELVHLTSNYAITQQKHLCDDGPLPTAAHANTLLPPAPVSVDRMMLTSMGGYLDAFGQWNPAKIDMNHQLTVQLWHHKATLGRDHYVKVLYKGYLAPFGLRASLVKVTQRVFDQNKEGNWVAIPYQHMYIVVKDERKQCPILGQPYGGRNFPFSYVEPVTLDTPYLNDPTTQPWPRDITRKQMQTQSLFWPMVPGPVPQVAPAGPPYIVPGTTAFNFRLKFTDITGVHSVEASMPLVFVGSDVAQQDGFGDAATGWGSQDAVNLYNSGSVVPSTSDDPWLTASFAGQKLSFAQSTSPGDTDFETDRIAWRVAPLTATVNVKLTNVAPSAFVTFTEVKSNQSTIQKLDGTGKFTIVLDSGNYTATVTMDSTHSVTSPTLLLDGSHTYSLTLALSDPTHFASPPVQTDLNKKTGPDPLDLYHYDLPYFYPAVDYAFITSTSIKRITGNSAATKFTFFGTYLTDGFNPATNAGEALLQKHPDDSLSLAFGGANKSVDKAGGLSNPDTLVVGFSRKAGAIGGKMDSTASPAAGHAGNTVVTSVSTFSSGKFDPADFFGGLTSAKLLGAVKLSDIIAPLASDLASNLGKAPQMLEQAIYEAAQYLHDCADAIAGFQAVANNPLATRLSAQAQQVATADATLKDAEDAGDPIAEGVAEGQAFSKIADYAAALQVAVQNPLSLVEDAVLDALTTAIQNTIAANTPAIQQQYQNLSDAFNATLDDTVQAVLQSLLNLETALATKVDDAMTFIATITTDQQQTIAKVAADLNDVLAIRSLVMDLGGRFGDLSKSFAALKSNPTSLQQVPQIVSETNAILVDVQQIYQKSGFLGVIISKATAGSAFAQSLLTLRDHFITAWTIDYTASAAVVAQLAAFEDDCTKLASVYVQTKGGQDILQNLRVLQSSVTKADAYGKKAVTGSVVQGTFRKLQLLQKMQAHILRALAALQALANQTLPAGLSAAVQASAMTARANILAQVSTLADSLTISPQLLNTAAGAGKAIELQLAALTSDPDVQKSQTASVEDIYDQLVSVRTQLAQDPTNVALKLLHYNLSIDYQRPLATALAYLAYIPSTIDLSQLVAVVGALETLAARAQAALCAIGTLWTQFRTKLSQTTGPLNTNLGDIINSLFGADLNAIDNAFTQLCSGGETTPSEYLRNCQAVVAGFAALEKDVRAKISSLPAAAAQLVADLKSQIVALLAQLLDDIPIPTSVNLSYTWNPDIQSCEPVFLLNDGASFTVKAQAEAGLSLTADSPSINASFDITATLTNFSIALIGDEPFITLVIKSLSFTSHDGNKPDCRMTLDTVIFGDQMKFVQMLADALDPSDGPFIEIAADSIRAGFRFAIESMTLGAFNLMQLAIEVAVALPFDGTPVRCEFGLSDQELPFLLSCGIYGGGGFLQLQLGLDGVQLLQGAFEFGVCADISIGPLTGSGYLVAGIYFRITANASEVCGFVHSHGHMDIFGIISMDVDLYVAICYETGVGVYGMATFSVSVSIAFFSESFSMQAEYSFAGSGNGNSTNSMLEMPGMFGDRNGAYQTADAFLVAPDDDRAMVMAPGPAKPKVPVPCPIQPLQNDIFVNEDLWKTYYNAFID
jgi:hypothetical protein